MSLVACLPPLPACLPVPTHRHPSAPPACPRLCSCLLSKLHSGAGEALDADVYWADPGKTAVGPTDVLLYCYYGALLEIGRCGAGGGRRWYWCSVWWGRLWCLGELRPLVSLPPCPHRLCTALHSTIPHRPAPPRPAPPLGRRRYARALDLLLSALTAPTQVLNAITVACLKKWMLLSLVHTGAVPQLPRHTAPLVS